MLTVPYDKTTHAMGKSHSLSAKLEDAPPKINCRSKPTMSANYVTRFRSISDIDNEAQHLGSAPGTYVSKAETNSRSKGATAQKYCSDYT